jgi:hypothetical protein
MRIRGDPVPFRKRLRLVLNPDDRVPGLEAPGGFGSNGTGADATVHWPSSRAGSALRPRRTRMDPPRRRRARRELTVGKLIEIGFRDSWLV